MACKCRRCPECKGQGYIFVSFSGEYTGPNRIDDFDEMESCDYCGGDGITDICDECGEIEEEEEKNWD